MTHIHDIFNRPDCTSSAACTSVVVLAFVDAGAFLQSAATIVARAIDCSINPQPRLRLRISLDLQFSSCTMAVPCRSGFSSLARADFMLMYVLISHPYGRQLNCPKASKALVLDAEGSSVISSNRLTSWHLCPVRSPASLCVDWPGILLAGSIEESLQLFFSHRKVHRSPCGQAWRGMESGVCRDGLQGVLGRASQLLSGVSSQLHKQVPEHHARHTGPPASWVVRKPAREPAGTEYAAGINIWYGEGGRARTGGRGAGQWGICC